jgi:hypothetical protein
MSISSAYDSMMAVSSVWGQNRTFRLIPLDINCPYVEGIYDPETKVLVLISKNMKQSYHMLPVLDDNGDAVSAKRPRANGKQLREERRLLDTYQEYYMILNEEIYSFLDKVIVNKDYDYRSFVEAPAVTNASDAAGIMSMQPE